LGDFGIHLDRGADCLVDAADNIAGQIPTELVLNTPRFRGDKYGQASHLFGIVEFAQHLTGAGHGEKMAAPATLARVDTDTALRPTFLHRFYLPNL